MQRGPDMITINCARIEIVTKVTFTYKRNMSYNGTTGRPSTAQHSTILVDGLYNPADLLVNWATPVVKNTGFQDR